MVPNVAGARSPAWNAMTVNDGRTGYMELLFPWQTPGTGLFRIDEAGNVTANNITTSIGLQPTDDATTNADNIQDAFNALIAFSYGNAMVTLANDAGKWDIEGGIIAVDATGYYLNAEGCWINHAGAGALVDFQDSSDYDARTSIVGGGLIGRPVIDGSGVTGAATAFQGGDIFRLRCLATVQNYTFAGSVPTRFVNRSWFTEGSVIRVSSVNCVSAPVFDVSVVAGTVTGSWYRGDIEIYVDQVDATFAGVVWQNGAFMVNGKFTLQGNFASSTEAVTTAALTLTGSTPGGAAIESSSGLGQGFVFIGVECGSGAFTPMSIKFGGGANQISSSFGNIDFGAGQTTGNFSPSNNAANLIDFFGPVTGDPALVSSLAQGSTNIVDGAQLVNSTSPANVAGVAVGVAAYASYQIRAWVPYSSAAAAGTPKFAFTGPGSQFVTNLVAKFWSGGVLASLTFLTDYTTTLTGPTLTSATTHLLEIEGTMLGEAYGTLQLTAWEGTGGDAFTIEAGACMTRLALDD